MTYHVARLAFMSVVLFLCYGCGQSRGQQLYAVKVTYDGSLTAINQMFRDGTIKDPQTALAIEAVSDEVYAGIVEAERRFAAGDNIGFDFAMIRLRSALDRFIRFKVQAKPLPAPKPPVPEPPPTPPDTPLEPIPIPGGN